MLHLDDECEQPYRHHQPVNHLPANLSNKILYYDKYDTRYHSLPWGKKIYIEYRLPQKKTEIPWLLMPYSMHPIIYDCHDETSLMYYRDKKRAYKLFFVGNSDFEKYQSFQSMRHIQKEFSMLNRIDIINAILKNAGEFGANLEIVKSSEDLKCDIIKEYANKFIFSVSPNVRIPQKDWLESVSSSDFFLSPPGTQMPWCHNIIEAMAVGTIPLTNYHNWFEVPLEDNVNCIAFHTEKDLIKGIKYILNMESDLIIEMRKNVIQYYLNHLSRKSFLNRIYNSESSGNMYVSVIIEDQETIKAINKNSILFRVNCI